jgi:hypothetical protein
MSHKFALRFGSGNPQTSSGLSPTFILFRDETGADRTPPLVTEVGVSSGLYYFNYVPSATFTIFFIADGGPAILDDTLRYVAGSLDPVAAVDRSLGFAEDSIGTTAVPSNVFGFVKRINEIWKADATFNKQNGKWEQYAAGTSTLLFSKTLANSTSQVTKSE